MKARVIHLLSDDDISLLLTGLTLLQRRYVEENNNNLVLLTQLLYDNIENCEDVGVINHENI